VVERNPDREESREPAEGDGPGTPEPTRPEPLDEKAAWAQIVAAYGEEPAEPPAEPGQDGPAAPDMGTDTDTGTGTGTGSGTREVHSITVFSAGSGPRDWDAAEPSDDDFDASDEGHFEQPDPPLPKPDTTAKFAWLAVLGGPLLLVVWTVLGRELEWWIALPGIGGFLGGFGTLVARMRPGGDDDDSPPGGGAVV
jgi:hypothetical protein